MGLLARFFKGALTIPHMMSMTWPELQFWFENYELQITEEEVVNKLRYDKKTGKERELPSPEKIRQIVDKQIEERRKKLDASAE